MKRVLAYFFVSFALCLNAEEWNQPQLDKATAFQKQFNGGERVKQEDMISSEGNSNGKLYILIGVAVVLIGAGAGLFIMKRAKKPVQKPEETEE